LSRNKLFDLPEEVHGEWAARRRLAQSIRDLTERCVRTEGDEAAMEAARVLVQQAAALLPEGGTASEAFADKSYHADPAKWIDRGALYGQSNPIAPPMEIEMEAGVSRCRLVLTESYVGAPGIVHGGILAACFDQICGHCAVTNGFPGMTSRLELRYTRPARVYTDLTFEAKLSEQQGRQVTVTGSVCHDGVSLATCHAVFVVLNQTQSRQIFGENSA